jgi:hypothetical protein
MRKSTEAIDGKGVATLRCGQRVRKIKKIKEITKLFRLKVEGVGAEGTPTPPGNNAKV